MLFIYCNMMKALYIIIIYHYIFYTIFSNHKSVITIAFIMTIMRNENAAHIHIDPFRVSGCITRQRLVVKLGLDSRHTNACMNASASLVYCLCARVNALAL